jgi:hypothetical protein
MVCSPGAQPAADLATEVIEQPRAVFVALEVDRFQFQRQPQPLAK